MFLMSLRILCWLALCALGVVVLPAYEALWIVAAIGGALLLYRLTPKSVRPDWVVIDGSNVMHWFDETPSLETVRLVATHLMDQGYQPIVWFDANVGYKVGGGYMNERSLAQHLPVSARAIRVAPKGCPADPLLLAEAIKLRARVVSNDKFRDWTGEFPQLADAAFLIPAKVHPTGLTMEISPAEVAGR